MSITNKYTEKLNKISVKGLGIAIAIMLFFMLIQFLTFYFKVLPTTRSKILDMADQNVANYVDQVLFKIFSGMWVWPLSFFALSGLFFYVMHNVKKIISSGHGKQD